MRHQRLFHRDIQLATEPIDPATPTVNFAYFCPACGSVWARLDRAGDSWATIRHFCELHPERTVVSAPMLGISELRIPGSFIHSPIAFFPLSRLHLAEPAFSDHEFRVHLAAERNFFANR